MTLAAFASGRPGDQQETGRDAATVAAVVVTRNRIDLLRKTLQSMRESAYPITELIVSDDSSTDETAHMLAAEFPEVIRIEGPQRGISANRNRGMSMVTADLILLSDDDMLVDTSFVGRAVRDMSNPQVGIVFCATSDSGRLIIPNTFNFLGFSQKRYKPGMPYRTANQQCFMLTRALARQMPYDEIIEAYGYEEMDFAYRVSAAGFEIHFLPDCAHIHLAPNANQPSRPEKDACRIYVTYKRLAYVDRRPIRSLLFLAVALPHHLAASVRRSGWRGIREAFSHFRLAARMLRNYQRVRATGYATQATA